MDRRKYLKTLALGTVSTGVILESCSPAEKEAAAVPNVDATAGPDRQPAELERYRKLMAETFFYEHEMKTITVLSDIIIPKDDVSGSATDAKVPEFIEFIVKDMPHHQLPMRGGLKWLDVQCMKRFDKSFVDCTAAQQIEMVDEIAFPEKAKPEMEQGVAFFNRMRDLTATGFFTSQIGVKDLGYAGNTPTRWDGVPQDVLDQYGMKYDEKTLKESVKFDET
ncbi:MAG: gluconate 2-dehydrogenase subunit 3 family protein [Cyclobacteriaceae bacterium]|nr:gluconate 2-dehydrogenase subunit 3 family protein [Cyclobacteriaceae bacterium]